MYWKKTIGEIVEEISLGTPERNKKQTQNKNQCQKELLKIPRFGTPDETLRIFEEGDSAENPEKKS